MSDADTKSVFETPLNEGEEARLDALADKDIDEGKGVPHAKVREWLLKLSKGEKTEPPSA